MGDLISLRYRWPYLTQTWVTSSHSDIGDRRRYWLSWLDSLVLLHPHFIIWLSNLSILSVPDEGYFERTRWRLFWVYQMKVILSVPDEGYFERNVWRLFWVYQMVILSVPDEGYFVPYEGYFERNWWRLFWAYQMKVILSTRWRLFWAYQMKVIMSVPDDVIPVMCWFWVYQMKVILSVPDVSRF